MGFKSTLLPVQNTICSKGKLLDLSTPVVMGILNATPDSFYTRGRNNTAEELLQEAERMIRDGAVILDIGGASSRPGAAVLPAEEELDRVLPLISAIQERFPDQWLSIDTYHATVAEAAVHAGAMIINDISGGSLDPEMLITAARLQVPYIAMHMQGTPATMQQNPVYDHITTDVSAALKSVCDKAVQAGITDILLDPGFGFGKTVAHNYQLLSEMNLLRIHGKPLLAGLSRKSMIWKVLDTDSDHALNGTTALHMAALQQGASILRVHDVKEAVETVRLYQQLS
jgi:dihydropteroate synthase